MKIGVILDQIDLGKPLPDLPDSTTHHRLCLYHAEAPASSNERNKRPDVA
jgi:hypothetical protein